MLTDQWQEFMKNSEYKKYQSAHNQNEPYLDNFQRNLMERYQLQYFREHPIAEELNRHSNKLIFKFIK